MITLAGVELSYEDPDGLITAWIERFCSVEDLRDQTWPPAALVSQRTSSRSFYEPGVNLPLPAYPPPPRVKLATLYWPTGAARWARCYLLATGNELTQVLGQLGNSNSAVNLVFTDQDQSPAVSITASMYLLAPRKLSAAVGGDDSLYLLTLVDQRYYWQWIESGDLQVTRASTWEDVFTQLATQLGAAIVHNAPAAGYAIPDPDELTRPYENVAVLLDAVARSVGQVIVVDLDGTVNSMDWQTSTGRYYLNKAAPTPIAGGDFGGLNSAAAYPEKITITFQKWREGAVDPNGDLYASTKLASAYATGGSTPGTVKTIHSTAFADFTSEGGAPDNDAEVEALANQIASDFFASLFNRYDVTLESLYAWRMSGFDDHAEWVFGRYHGRRGNAGAGEGDPGADSDESSYQAYTRAQCRAYNFGEEEQLSQFSDKPVYPSPARFKLAENLIPLVNPNPLGNSAAAFFQTFDAITGEWADTTDQLTVWDPENTYPGLLNEYGYVAYKGDSLRWEIVELDNRFLHGVLNADLTPGNSALCTVWQSTLGVEAATAMIVPVWGWQQDSIPQGAKVHFRWEKESSRFYVLPAMRTILGKTTEDSAGDAKNNNSVTVAVYGGQQGSEAAIASGSTITAWLKLHGAVVKDTWVICEYVEGTYPASSPTAKGAWYVVGAIRGNSFCARVKDGEADPSLGYCDVDKTIQAEIYYGSAAGKVDDLKAALTVDCRVIYAPLLNQERMQIEWTGDMFVATKAEMDGGFYADAGPLNINKDGVGFVNPQPYLLNSAITATNVKVTCKLGDINTNSSTKRVYVQRNRGGMSIPSAEC